MHMNVAGLFIVGAGGEELATLVILVRREDEYAPRRRNLMFS